MRNVSLISKYDGLMVTCHEGIAKGTRLWAQAPGLNVYLKGTAGGVSRDRLTNLVSNIALEMHIPLISLQYVVKGKL